MSERERNMELVRRQLEGFSQDDPDDVVVDILHPEIESHVSSRMMNAGTWHGVDGFFEMAAAWYEAWEDLRYEILDLEAPDDRHVLASCRQVAKGRESGVPVQMPVVFLFEIEDGLARRLHIYPEREAALAAI